uniref:Uncharacterized protein n=1 Tax=Caenorhabditis japonica TaxID=281687 RepID=A0A8R1ESG7_CAEJA
MKFCSRHSSKNETSEWMMRVFRLISERATQLREDSEKQKQIDESLRAMCKQILATGTKYAKQLVDQLLESPSFIESNFLCGHFQHIECSTNVDRTCTCNGVADSHVVPREKPDAQTKRNIFEHWDTKLNCRVFPKDS